VEDAADLGVNWELCFSGGLWRDSLVHLGPWFYEVPVAPVRLHLWQAVALGSLSAQGLAGVSKAQC